MYTKPETYYEIVLRKSPKSYRASNYKHVVYEFKTKEIAETFLNTLTSDTLEGFCEAIIVEHINKPVKTIKLK